MSLIKPGGNALTGLSGLSGLFSSAFSWTNVSNIEARFDFSDLNTMKTRTAADFSGAAAERFNAGNTAFSFGDTDWWFGLWVRSDTAGSGDVIFQQINAGDNGSQLIKLATEVVRWRVYDGVDTILATATTSGTLTNNTWHFVFAYHDSVNNEIGVSIDNTAFVTAATSGAAGASASPFYFGNASTNSWDGQMDEIAVGESPTGGFTTTTPTAIRNALYNSGNGVSYSDLSSAQKTAWGLVSFFDLNEVSGDRYDSHGTNILTDENTVGSADGKVQKTVVVEDRARNFVAAGSNQYLQANSSLSITYPFTLATWIRTSSGAGGVAILSQVVDKSAATTFAHLGFSVGKPRAEITNGAATGFAEAATTYNDSQAHLVVGVFTSNTSRTLYVDDASPVTNTATVELGTYDRLSIGRSGDVSPSGYFDGDLDEVMVFDAAISQAEVNTLWNSGKGVIISDLNSVDSTLYAKLTHAYSLDANSPSGVTTDRIGSLTLTDSNTTDVRGVVPANSSGGIVRLVEDQENSNDLFQNTIAKRPLPVTASVSDTGIRFDGTDDVLQSAAFGAALTQPNTLMFVSIFRDQGADQGAVDGIAAGNEQSFQVESTADVGQLDSGTADASALGIDYANAHIWTCIFNGASSKLYRDGGSGETLNTGSETMTGVTVGTLQDGSTSPADMDIMELVIIDGQASLAEINAIGQEWANTYGISWTTAT